MIKYDASMVPPKIIVETEDKEYIVAQLHYFDQINNGPTIILYKQKSYYHRLDDAIKGEFK